jgi:hypothetical protein
LYKTASTNSRKFLFRAPGIFNKEYHTLYPKASHDKFKTIESMFSDQYGNKTKINNKTSLDVLQVKQDISISYTVHT